MRETNPMMNTGARASFCLEATETYSLFVAIERMTSFEPSTAISAKELGSGLGLEEAIRGSFEAVKLE